MARKVRAAPKMAPGKKPATTALLGKEGQDSLVAVVFMRMAVEVDVVVDDGVDVDVEVEEEVVVSDEESLSRMQVPPLHLYPNGQHELPHFGSLSFNLDVLRGFVGYRVGFWRLMSQEIGLI